MKKTTADTRSIDDLLKDIESESLVVPEFQRDYDWEFRHIDKLFESLSNDNPIGAVCIWSTDLEIPLRNLNPKKTKNFYEIILDGQQRLSSLYYLFKGNNPPYYAKQQPFFEKQICFNYYTNKLTRKKSISEKDLIEGWVNPQRFYGGGKFTSEEKKLLKSTFEGKIGRSLDNNAISEIIIETNKDESIKSYEKLQKIFSEVGLCFLRANVNSVVIGPGIKIALKKELVLKLIDEKQNQIAIDNFLSMWNENIKPYIPEDIIEELNDNPSEFALENTFTKFKCFADYEIPIIKVKTDLKDAVEIFDTINTAGKGLPTSELIRTYLVYKWPKLREEIKDFQKDLLSRYKYKFNDADLLRFLVTKLAQHGNISECKDLIFSNNELSDKDISQSWALVKKGLEHLIKELRVEGFIDSSLIPASNALVVPVYYFSMLLKNGNLEFFKNDSNRKKFFYWLHIALIEGRYEAHTNTMLETDIKIVQSYLDEKIESLWDDLVTKIEPPNQLPTTYFDNNKRVFNALKVFYMKRGAKDFFTGSPLTEEDKETIEVHHFFPKNPLSEAKYPRDLIDNTCNLTLVHKSTNKKFWKKLPIEYLSDNQYKESFLMQGIDISDKKLLKIENYEEFLAQRKLTLHSEFNKWIDSYRSNPEEKNDPLSAKALQEVIQIIEEETDDIENSNLELKESLWFDIKRYDYDKNNNKILPIPSYKSDGYFEAKMKTICGFLNSKIGGGCYLVIGASDDGDFVGLDRDKEIVSSYDRLLRDFKAKVKKHFEEDVEDNLVSWKLFEVKEQRILFVHVTPYVNTRYRDQRWPKSIRIKDSDISFIREGADTIPMSPNKIRDIINSRED